MNRVYQSVFNKRTGLWQVASELAKSAGKKSNKTGGTTSTGTLVEAGHLSPSRITGNSLNLRSKTFCVALVTALGGLASQTALADCTPGSPGNGVTVTCSGGTATGNPFNTAANNLTVNVASTGRVAPVIDNPSTAMTLSGNNVTLNNAGMIDPSFLGIQSQLVKGTLVGNANASNHAITNTGGLYGTFGVSSVNVGDLTGVALDVRNGAGGTTTIVNSGTIGGKPLSGVSVLATDAPVLVASGQGNINFTNTAGGTVQGRIGLNGTSNTLINNGQILGSVYLGGGNDTFVADTGASVSSTGVGVALSVPDQLGVGVINFASAGVVDGGTGVDTLTLKSDAGNGANTATSSQYINFENLNITGGRWTLVGRLANASNLTGGTAVLNSSDNLGATATVSGAAFESGVNGLGVTTALNLQGAGLTVQGTNTLGLAGAISGAGALTKTGSGALSLAAGNTWSGGTTLNSGSILLGGNGALGTGAVNVTGSSTLTASAATTLANRVAVGGGTTLTLNGAQSLTLNGALSGSGNVIKAGAGTLTLGTVNTQSGSLSINGGTVAMGAGGTLAPTQAVTLSAGTTLDLSAGGNQTIGSLAGTGGTVELGATTLTTGGLGTSTSYAGTLSGTGGLVKIGGGVQSLSGSNTFTGGVALNGGGLLLGNAGALGTGTLGVGASVTLDTTTALTLFNNVSLNIGGTLNMLGGQPLVLSGDVSGMGNLVKNGGSSLTLNGVNTFSGGTSLNAGGLVLGNSGALGTGALNVGGAATLDSTTALNVTNAVNLGNGTSLTMMGSEDVTLSGVVAGNGTLVKNGASVLTLNNANTFAAGTNLNAGGLIVGNNTALGSGALTIGGTATLDTSAPVSLTNNVVLNAGLTVLGSNALTLDGNISGTGSLTKDGAATLTLNGTNTYTGGTNINSGTLALGLGASLASSGIVNVATGATFDLSAGNGTQTFGTLVGGGTVNLGSNALTIGGPTNGTFDGSIGGTGGLIKEGTGTSTLTGANTYTGGTLVNAGTLAIGAGGSLASTGAVTLAAAGTGFDISTGGNQSIGRLNGVAGSTINLGGNALTINNAVDGVYDGQVAGTGRLIKNGAGVQTLGGANTFSGGTTLNAGGLILGNNGALGTGALSVGGIATLDNNAALTIGNQISVAPGAALTVLGSHGLTLTNTISGNGGLIKDGASTLTLTGANSYTGGTTINAGTLAIFGGGNLSSTGAVNLAGLSTFDISAGSSQTVGAFSGVAGSTVALGSNTLTFGSASDAIFDGSFNGAGGLIKNGAGVQTLNGASTFNGGITLNAGGFNLGNDAALGTGSLTVGGAATFDTASVFTIANNMTLNAALTALGTNDLTLSGSLSGAGSLIKDGLSTLTLTGSNSYTGGTFINSGTLRVSNTNSSAVTVNAGGTLSGTGSVGSTSVANGAIVHVDAGKLDINGSYAQGSGGVLRIDAGSAAQYGQLDVTGTATFATDAKIDVNVLTVNTLAIGNTLSKVIKAGTLNASTFDVTDNSALFNFKAFLTSDNGVDLRVFSSSTTGIQDAVSQQGPASAAGAAVVLDRLLNTGADGDMGTVITALGQLSNSADVSRAIAQTLPVVSGNQAVRGALTTFQGLVQGRGDGGDTKGMSSGDTLLNKNGWGKIFGSRAEQDNRSGASGFKADTWGLALGGDAEVAPGARFGMAYGYAKTSVNGNTDLSGTAQRANIDSHMIAAYGSKDIGGNRTFSFQGDLGMNDNKSTRQIDFGGLNRTARADYRTYSAHMGAAIAQAFDLSEKTTLTPALRADYTWLKSQGYNERGADALNLSVGSNKTDAFVIGADAYLQHRFSNTSRFDANLGVGYDVINEQGNIVAAYAGAPGQSFVTTGIDHSPWLVRGGIGYSLTAANGTAIDFRYDAESRSDYLNHTASVRAKWAF